MKFNPYAALVTTGLLMLATVVFAQTRSSVALMKAGAASVDKDVSRFAAKAVAARGSGMSGTRVASTDPPQGRVLEE
jgi:hypothetical protein